MCIEEGVMAGERGRGSLRWGHHLLIIIWGILESLAFILMLHVGKDVQTLICMKKSCSIKLITSSSWDFIE